MKKCDKCGRELGEGATCVQDGEGKCCTVVYSRNVPTGSVVTASEANAVECRDCGVPVKAKKVWAVGSPVEFQWMPGGQRTITANYGRGKQNVPIELTVQCDADSAKAVQASFEAIKGANPRRPPYGCVEHRAEERAFEPLRFSWKDDPEPAIYCECDPSELGARNVNGKIHTSFSPTFDTDAEYGKLECSGCGEGLGKCGCGEKHVFRFTAGARGSAANPARVTRLDAQSVGSLTNWPAFKDILPVAAREPDAVRASGTSEGARKGWQERTTAAYKATTVADTFDREKSGDNKPETLKQGAVLHDTAAEAHNSANYHLENAEDISETQAEIVGHRHAQLSAHHKHAARRYREMAVRREAANATDPLAALSARVKAADAALAEVKAGLSVEQQILMENKVTATWSDAAREAALEARRAHSMSAGIKTGSKDFAAHREAAEAHKRASDKYHEAINKETEGGNAHRDMMSRMKEHDRLHAYHSGKAEQLEAGE